MLERTSSPILNTVAVARQIADFSLQKAQVSQELQEGEGPQYRIITVVFSAFLFEGTISAIGEILDPKWDVSAKDKDRPISRAGWRKQHKHVRRLLGFSNDAIKEIHNSFIEPIMNFRDKFTHPKIITEQERIEGINDEMEFLSPIDWEDQICDLNRIADNLERLKSYCNELVDCAEHVLQQESKNIDQLNSFLKGLLYSTHPFVSSIRAAKK